MEIVRPYTVEGYEADLVEDVEVVKVAFVENELEEKGWGVNID